MPARGRKILPDPRLRLGDLGIGGQIGSLTPPIPEFQQRQRGRIEDAAGEEMQLVAEREDAVGIGVERDRFLAGGGVDAADERGVPEARPLRLERGDPRQHRGLERRGDLRRGDVSDAATGAERAEGQLARTVDGTLTEAAADPREEGGRAEVVRQPPGR